MVWLVGEKIISPRICVSARAQRPRAEPQCLIFRLNVKQCIDLWTRIKVLRTVSGSAQSFDRKMLTEIEQRDQPMRLRGCYFYVNSFLSLTKKLGVKSLVRW